MITELIEAFKSLRSRAKISNIYFPMIFINKTSLLLFQEAFFRLIFLLKYDFSKLHLH